MGGEISPEIGGYRARRRGEGEKGPAGVVTGGEGKEGSGGAVAGGAGQ